MAARSPKALTPRSPPIGRSRSPTWARSRQLMAALLRIEGISVGYDRADVLRDVSLAVEAGAVTPLPRPHRPRKTTPPPPPPGPAPPPPRGHRLFRRDHPRPPAPYPLGARG